MPALFPGAVGLTMLEVYDWEAADGERGGAPHMHLACSECYVVVEGRGRLQTLSPEGFREIDLSPGDVVWYEPGTIHRSINDGGLRIVVVMQNSGLPEAGDAVMTFPDEHLVSRERYLTAAAITDASGAASAERARARRDLALEGFGLLRRSLQRGEASAFESFSRRAVAIVAPVLDRWAGEVHAGALAAAQDTQERIAALRRGDSTALRRSRTGLIRLPKTRTFGMCGMLCAYDPVRRSQSSAPDVENERCNGPF